MINLIKKELDYIAKKETGLSFEEIGVDLTYNAGQFDGVLNHVRIMSSELDRPVTVKIEKFYGPEDAVFDIMDEIRELDVYKTPYLKYKLGEFIDGGDK